LSSPATAASDAGTYPILAAQGSLRAVNYNFAFANGTLEVTPAAPTTPTVTPLPVPPVSGQTTSVATPPTRDLGGVNFVISAASGNLAVWVSDAAGTTDATASAAAAGQPTSRRSAVDLSAILSLQPERSTSLTVARSPELLGPGPFQARSAPAAPTPTGWLGVSESMRARLAAVPQAPAVTDLAHTQAAQAPLPVEPAQSPDPRAARVESSLSWVELDSVERPLSGSNPPGAMRPLAVTGLLATSGYLLLNTRIGYWLLGLLTSRPLWKEFDPLDLLFNLEREYPDLDGNETTLQSLVK
jgi:hypothetical protein